MDECGFIHGKLDVKILVLYVMSRVVCPVDMSILAEVALCDGGVNYFTLAEAANGLVDTGHLTLTDCHFAITDKGREHAKFTESSLSVPVRWKCDDRLARVNPRLRRAAQVRSTVTPREGGGFDVELILDDEKGNLLTLRMLTGGEEQAKEIARRFQAVPERVYDRILHAVLPSEPNKELPDV